MAMIGSIEPYDPSSGDWEAYQERLEMFLEANAVAEGQRVATLLTVIGGTAYKIVRNLVLIFDLIYWICTKAGTLYKTVQNSMLYMR